MGTANTGTPITHEVTRHRGPHSTPPLASGPAEAWRQDTAWLCDKVLQLFGLLTTGMTSSQGNSQTEC